MNFFRKTVSSMQNAWDDKKKRVHPVNQDTYNSSSSYTTSKRISSTNNPKKNQIAATQSPSDISNDQFLGVNKNDKGSRIAWDKPENTGGRKYKRVVKKPTTRTTSSKPAKATKKPTKAVAKRPVKPAKPVKPVKAAKATKRG